MILFYLKQQSHTVYENAEIQANGGLWTLTRQK